MAAQDLVITITARDQATEVLRTVRGEVGQTAESFKLPAGAVDAFRGALDKLGGVIPGVSGSVRGLTGAMASVGGAASGLVSSVLAYGVALNRVADDQARFQRTLQSLNADAIRGELARVNDELNRMADIGTRIGNDAGTWTGALQSFLSRLQLLPQAARETFLGAQTPEAQREAALRVLGGVLGVREGATQTQLQSGIEGTRQRAILFEQQRRLNAEDLGGARALEAQLDAADRRERELALRALQQRQGIQRSEAIAQGLPTAPLEETFRLERQALEGELANSLQRQKLAREEQAKSLFEKQVDQRFAPLVTQQEFEQKAAEEEFALGAELERQAKQKADAALEAGDARLRMAQTQADFEREAADQQVALDKELDRQRTARAAGQLETAAQTARVLQEQNSLTAAGFAQAQLVTIEAQKQLDLSRARSDAERELVDLTARVQSENVARREIERTDPAAGLDRGFRDVADEAAAAGDRMRTAFVNSYHDISQSFSDIVVDGLTNQGDKIGEIGKQMGKRLLAGFVDQLSAQLFGRAFAALGQSVGVGTPGQRVFTAIPAVASPFAAVGAAGAGAGGGAGSPILGSTYQPFASPGGGAAASPASLRPGGIPGGAAASPASGGFGDIIGAVGQFTSGFFGPSVSAVDLVSAYSLGGFSAVAAVQSGSAVVVSTAAGPALVHSGGDLALALGAGVGESAATSAGTAGAAGGAAGAGATAATVAGGVLAAAALAYTAYSAYQSGDVAGGAIGGAISGAALGTVINPGIGTVVGLIVGAAIGAGAGQAGKDAQEVALDRRRNEADRQRRGAWIYQDLMTAIQTGIDQEDIAEQTVRTGQSVGGLLMGVAALNQSGFLADPPWTWAPSDNARQTLAILAGFGHQPILDFQWDRLNSTAELIASWHQPRGLTEGDIEIARNAEALMAAFVNKRGSTVLIGYDEQLSTGLRGAAGRATRQTLIPSSRAREAAGQDLFVVGGSTDALDDDQLQRLLQRLAKVDRDRDLQILRIESDFGATVTVGHLNA